jgi:hypothetical protein
MSSGLKRRFPKKYNSFYYHGSRVKNIEVIIMLDQNLTAYLKRYGFLLPNAEIYGGLAKS